MAVSPKVESQRLPFLCSPSSSADSQGCIKKRRRLGLLPNIFSSVHLLSFLYTRKEVTFEREPYQWVRTPDTVLESSGCKMPAHIGAGL